jgi:hypothetical protein
MGRTKVVVAAVVDMVAMAVIGVIEAVEAMVVVIAVGRRAVAKRIGTTAIHTLIRSSMTVAA